MAAGTTSTPSRRQTVSDYSVFAAVERCIRYESEYDQRHQSSLKDLVPIIIVVLSLLVFFALAIIPYVSHCSRLEPKLPRFLVDSASFSKLNFSGTNLTANGLVSLRVINDNPNYSVSHDKLHAVLFYGGESKQPLDVARAPPFYQGRLSESIIRFQFDLVNEYVGEEMARISDAEARACVDFGVQVKAWTAFEPEEMQEQKLCLLSSLSSISPSNLKIHCNPVTFGLSSRNDTGSMLIPSRECEVHDDHEIDD